MLWYGLPGISQCYISRMCVSLYSQNTYRLIDRTIVIIKQHLEGRVPPVGRQLQYLRYYVHNDLFYIKYIRIHSMMTYVCHDNYLCGEWTTRKTAFL